MIVVRVGGAVGGGAVMHTLVGFPGATGVVIVDEDLFRLGLEGRLEGANLRAALGSGGWGRSRRPHPPRR